MIADINSFVNRLRRDCKTGLLNRTNNVISRNATNTLSHTLVNLLFVIGVLLSFDRTELQHKFWQPNVQQDSITAQFNYHSIQLQHIQFLSITTNQTGPKGSWCTFCCGQMLSLGVRFSR
ncbi:hypothetical protein LXL04_010540 [Taraxacum kok-saghyz]